MPTAWGVKDKVAICIPHERTTSMAWAIGFAYLKADLIHAGVPHTEIWHFGSIISDARNWLVDKALEVGASWVFFLDTDILPPADVVRRLLSHGKPIVSGVYYSKTPPIVPTFRRLREKDGEAALWTMSDEEWPKDRLFEVDAVGMGCCLIQADVFQRVPKPWFRWNMSDYEPLYDGIPKASEDYYFCLKAKKHGYSVWVDPRVQCGHWAFAVVTQGKLGYAAGGPLGLTL